MTTVSPRSGSQRRRLAGPVRAVAETEKVPRRRPVEAAAGPNGAVLQVRDPRAAERLQGAAGNAAVGQLLAGSTTVQRDAITPASIGQALGRVTVDSSTDKTVGSLRPWAIFEMLPWNPSGGKKGRLFSQLKAAYGVLHRAEAGLAEAQHRAAAAAAAGPAAPAARPRRGGRHPRRARALPTVAQAQATVDAAQRKVDDVTTDLKTYVKSMLNSRRNPRMAAALATKKAAGDDRRTTDRQLARARRGRHPDHAEIDRLSRLQTTQQAAETAANTAAATLLTTLKSEVDAADWSPQNVTQTTAVYSVDGAAATLYNRVEAYATITADGFEGKAVRTATGGPTVTELLNRDVTLGPSAKKILAIISSYEGGFTSLNTWDIADVTWGMVQWTTGEGGQGDLIRALSIVKATAPAAFETRLAAYGIDVDASRGLIVTRADGTVLDGEAAAKALKVDPKLSAVLAAAGTDAQIQAAELHAANDIEISGALNHRLDAKVGSGAAATTVHIPVSALITSEFGVGVLANHTVHGGYPGGALQAALKKFVQHHPATATPHVADWAATAESDLVAAISDGIDAARTAQMRRELDGAAGTFR